MMTFIVISQHDAHKYGKEKKRKENENKKTEMVFIQTQLIYHLMGGAIKLCDYFYRWHNFVSVVRMARCLPFSARFNM